MFEIKIWLIGNFNANAFGKGVIYSANMSVYLYLWGPVSMGENISRLL